MKTIQELKDERVACVAEAEAVIALAEKDDSELTEDETATFDGAMANADKLGKAIERLETVAVVQAAIDKPGTPITTPSGGSLSTPLDTHVGPDREMEDPTGGFASLGHLAIAIAAREKSEAAPNDKRLDILKIRAAASGASQAVGSNLGWFVPPAFSSLFWDRLNDPDESLLARTDQFPVTGESLTFVANAETSRATGSRYGGIQGAWIAEADTIAASTPKVRKLTLVPHELAVLTKVTNKLLRNAPAVTTYLQRAAFDEINFLIGNAIVNGTGAGQPKGVLSTNSNVSVAKEAAQSAATLVSQNLYKMYTRLHPRALTGASWYINQDVWPQLFQLSQAVGTGGAPLFIAPGQIQGAPQARILGLPVVVLEYCATLGTVGDIILGNFNFYASGTQGGLESAESMHIGFEKAEHAFRFMFAVDGQTWMDSAITPFKGTANTLHSFVTLATRG